jgi:glucosamine-6-phosphate deaminase
MIELQRDRLRVSVFPDRASMGMAAADYVAERLRRLLAGEAGRRARVLFAAAASQAEFLDALGRAEGIDWARVDAFQMDEYVGLARDDERSFGEWLDRRIFSIVQPGRVERLDPTTTDPAAECRRYGALLADGGLDLALVGIGENGHVAFNDPHVADFEDPEVVKPVEIDETSRAQQVRDGAFVALELVPRLAMTVTMSTILASGAISVVVPGPLKAPAVARTLDGPIETACPASALRHHPDVVMFTEEAAVSSVAH